MGVSNIGVFHRPSASLAADIRRSVFRLYSCVLLQLPSMTSVTAADSAVTLHAYTPNFQTDTATMTYEAMGGPYIRRTKITECPTLDATRSEGTKNFSALQLAMSAETCHAIDGTFSPGVCQVLEETKQILEQLPRGDCCICIRRTRHAAGHRGHSLWLRARHFQPSNRRFRSGVGSCLLLNGGGRSLRSTGAKELKLHSTCRPA